MAVVPIRKVYLSQVTDEIILPYEMGRLKYSEPEDVLTFCHVEGVYTATLVTDALAMLEMHGIIAGVQLFGLTPLLRSQEEETWMQLQRAENSLLTLFLSMEIDRHIRKNLRRAFEVPHHTWVLFERVYGYVDPTCVRVPHELIKSVFNR